MAVQHIKRDRTKYYLIFVELILGLLVAQYLLGMWANLFANFPPPPAVETQGFAVAQQILHSGLPLVIVHAVNGLLMLGISGFLVYLGKRTGDKKLLVTSIAGMVSFVVAVYSGYHFVFSGWSDNVYSYAMSLGFLSALIAYTIGASVAVQIKMRQIFLLPESKPTGTLQTKDVE